MKKPVKFLLFVLTLLLTATAFAACKTSGVKKKAVLSVENAKTQFIVGEEFSTGDIAVFVTKDGEKTQIPSDLFTIDSSAVDILTAGTYVVTISTVSDEKTLSVGYSVTYVTPEEKSAVAMPEACNDIFTYNGDEQTYEIAENPYYTVNGNTQTDAGVYMVTVSLNDKNSYVWADGTSDDIAFDFVIGKATPTITVDQTPITAICNAITLPEASTDLGQLTVVWSEENHTTAGSYTATFSVAGTKNLNHAEKSVSVTVVHNESEMLVDLPATKDAPGHKHTECTGCGETLSEQTIPNRYIARENVSRYFVRNNTDTAWYNWYFAYGENGVEVTVDIEDENICYPGYEQSAENIIGMSDNIEFSLQIASPVTGLVANETLNILVNPIILNGWARYATGTSTYSADGNVNYKLLLSKGLLKVSCETRTLGLDGYDGATVKVTVDYSLIGGKDVGNTTVAFSSRNTSDTSDNSAWRHSVLYGERWNRADTFAIITADGSLEQRYFDIPDLNELTAMLVPHENASLLTDLAEITTASEVARYEEGAVLFNDRVYLVEGLGIPEGFTGLSFIRGSINGGYSFTVSTEGYVISAMPSTGFDSAKKYFTDNGFTLIAEGLPRLGFSGANMGISENTNYYVKWCEAGEEYTMPRWGVIIFATRESYAADPWVQYPATVYALNSDELNERFANSTRLWQGIPGIQAISDGDKTRLWACWFSGADHEPAIGNYAIFAFSDDEGETWTKAFIITCENDKSRVFDESLFLDENGELWLMWNQTFFGSIDEHMGVWYAKVSNPMADASSGVGVFEVSAPVRICDGLKLNKPIIMSDGSYVFFTHAPTDHDYVYFRESTDKGATWHLKGKIYVPNYTLCTESTIAESTVDGQTVYMSVHRTDVSYNVAVSYSYDRGATWTKATEFLLGASSRPRLETLPSGNIIYIQHYETTAREKMSVRLSEDGGKTFTRALILDARNGVSYPDVSVADGKIYIVWDRNRYNEKQVLMAIVTEEELLAINGIATLDAACIKDISTLDPVLAGLTGKISGVIRDEENAPVVGATVTIGSKSALTDENGAYSIAGLTVADTQILVEKEGYADALATVTTKGFIDAERRKVTANLTMKLLVEVTLKGTVKDVFGDAIAGLNVSIGTDDVETDENGRFSFENIILDNFTLTFTKAGFASDSLLVGAEMFTNENGFVYDLTKTCAFENTAELGLIGGTASDVDKTNGHVFRVYAQRTDTALVVYIAKDDLSELPAGYTIELYSHVYNFVKSRTENTLDTMITTDGTISRVAAFPSNKMTNITNLGVTAQKINDKYVKATIPYAHLYQFVPSWYTADIRTPLGLSMVARNSTYSGCSVWYRPDMPGFSNSQEVVRGNTKDYIMIAADGTLSLTFKEDRITKDIFNELAGVNVFDNLAETTSSSTKSTVTLGGYPFSDRTTHTFDGGMIKALDGMHYYYDGVKENTAVTATTAGYIIVVDSVKNSGIPENCQAVITNAANIGLLTAGATLTDYYIVYLEAGESFTAFGTGDVLIIGA